MRNIIRRSQRAFAHSNNRSILSGCFVRGGDTKSFHSTSNIRDKSSSNSTTTTPWKRFVNLVGSALASDDRINPKKILERRYLYFALTALRYRQLRQDFPDADASDLKVQAVEELHSKRQVDELANVSLRAEMHKMMAPQILDILMTFDGVDKSISIVGATADASSSSDEFFDQLDWENLKNILQQEEHDTATQLDQTKREISSDDLGAKQSLAFLKIKLGALQTLLHFHNLRADPPEAHSADGVDYFGMDMESMKDNKTRRTEMIRMYQTINLCRSALIRKSTLGYSVLCLRSTINGGGRGTFVDGKGATMGSLVAFQPGDVWPKEHLLTSAPDVVAHFDDDDEDCQTSLRFDDYVLDSRTSPVTILSREGTMNPWALGHMVNHPSPGDLPNSQSLMLDFTEKMSLRELLRYVPNVYARPPGWQSRFFDPEPVLMHSLCLLARKDIKNQELFYDYRLQSNETPEWYAPVSYGDDFLDKEQIVFFRDDWKK